MKKMSSKISLSSQVLQRGPIGAKRREKSLLKGLRGDETPPGWGVDSVPFWVGYGADNVQQLNQRVVNLAMKKTSLSENVIELFNYTKAELDKCDINKSMTIYIALRMLYILGFPYIKTTLLQLNRWQSSQALKHVALGCIWRTNPLVFSEPSEEIN